MKLYQRILGLAGALYVLCAPAHSQTSDTPRTPDRFAGTYVMSITTDTILVDPAEIECAFLESIGELLSCSATLVIQLSEDGSMIMSDADDVEDRSLSVSLGNWERSGRRLLSTRTIGSSTSRDTLTQLFSVFEAALSFEPGLETFTASYTITSFDTGVDPLDPESLPSITQIGTAEGRRF